MARPIQTSAQTWEEMAEASAARAFEVMNALPAAVVSELHRVVEEAVAEQIGIQEFRSRFRQVLVRDLEARAALARMSLPASPARTRR